MKNESEDVSQKSITVDNIMKKVAVSLELISDITKQARKSYQKGGITSDRNYYQNLHTSKSTCEFLSKKVGAGKKAKDFMKRCSAIK